MAGIKDPAFWRRFSLAVHMDEEQQNTPGAPSFASGNSDVKYSANWVEQQRKEKKRAKLLGWLIAFLFALIIAAIVFVVLWLARHGWFMHGDSDSDSKSD
ncbi:MAG: hypothetical protein M1834_006990 [Cirrosporium novae-zelandiae]|nr:MAG: hypothetical protein M1834_006990 [Cirrosporium novae-zelandiae]